jgi:hypothetical protein
MASEQTLQHDGSFVVRIWWEHGGHTDGDGRGPTHWRGWIQHVRNGNQIYFASLADMIRFIEQETGIHPAKPAQASGLV